MHNIQSKIELETAKSSNSNLSWTQECTKSIKIIKKSIKIHRYHFSGTLNFGRCSSIQQPVTDANDTIIHTTNAQGIVLLFNPPKTKNLYKEKKHKNT